MSDQPQQPQPNYGPPVPEQPAAENNQAQFQGQNFQGQNADVPLSLGKPAEQPQYEAPQYGQAPFEQNPYNQQQYGQPQAQQQFPAQPQQFGQPQQYGQNAYGAPQPGPYGAPPFQAPTQYYGGPGYVDNTSGPRGLSLSSMIIGLASLLVGFGFLIIPQIVGIILGHMGLSKESPQGKAFSITGLITNYLALLIYGGLYIFFFFIIGVAATNGWESESTTYYSSMLPGL